MRDWSQMDVYYSETLADIYEQPDSEGHTALAGQVINRWISMLVGCHKVLDVGCGQGFAQPLFEHYGVEYTGVSLGMDAQIARERGRNVLTMDMNFLDFPNDSFELVWSRHSLEHSPFPLLSLMEWNRVSKAWLCLILPKPNVYGWTCPNHYGIMAKAQAVTLLERAGWAMLWQMECDEEYRFMCEKRNRFYTHQQKFEIPEKAKDEDHSSGSDV